MKKYLLMTLSVFISVYAHGMEPMIACCADNTLAKVKNESSFDIEDLIIKVKINGKKGKIKIPSLPSDGEIMVDLAQATTKKGDKIVDDANEIESLEVIKIRPKTCTNPQTGDKALCRGRLKPDNKMQREFIIADEKAGVVKVSRRERGKGKLQFEQPEPRLVRVQSQ